MLRLRILGLGDSTTAGTPGFLSPLEAPPDGSGNAESQYAYWMMKGHPDWIVVNRGINGQRSDEILARFYRDVVREEPDYVIVLAGVNDVYQGYPRESVQRNLLAMYRLAGHALTIPVAATILPYNSASPRESDDVRALNQWIAETARGLGILFCDTSRAVADPGNPNRLRGSPDGFHPDVAGYRSMAQALAETIETHVLRSPEL